MKDILAIYNRLRVVDEDDEELDIDKAMQS